MRASSFAFEDRLLRFCAKSGEILEGSTSESRCKSVVELELIRVESLVHGLS